MTTNGAEGTEPIHEEIQLPDLVLLSSSQNSQPFDALSSQDTQFTSDTVDLTDVEAMEIDCGQHDYRNGVQIVLQSVTQREDVDSSQSGQHLDDACTESQESDEACLDDEMMDDEQESCPFSQPSPTQTPSQLHSHYVHLLSSFTGDHGNTSIMPLTPVGNWTQEHGLPHQVRMIPLSLFTCHDHRIRMLKMIYSTSDFYDFSCAATITAFFEAAVPSATEIDGQGQNQQVLAEIEEVIKGPFISSDVGVGKYISTGQPPEATQPPCSPTHSEDCCTGATASYKNSMELPEQSAEIREAVASIATESKEDSPISDTLTDEMNRQISPPHHLSMEQGSPLRDSASPLQPLRPLTAVLQPFHPPGCDFPISSHNLCQVLYQLKGNTQMLVINSTNPGQLKAVHVLPPGQLMDNKGQCVQFNSLAGSMENTAMHPGEVTGYLGKVLPMSTPQASGLNIQQGQSPAVNVAQPFSQQCASPIFFPSIRPNLPNLTAGSAKVPALNKGNLAYTVVPTEYLTQLQQAPGGPIPENGNLASEARVHIPPTISLTRLPILTTDSRSKKPCNCTKSQCLKLYCDCFANGEFCSNCNCTNCFNNFEHEAERFKAIKACLDRNPEAFRPKIGKGMLGEIKLRHNKGCNCKRSGCLKNYCECYEAKIMCSSICKCIGCRNYEESPERRTLMNIPDHSDMSLCQPRTKLFPEIFNCREQVKVNRERYPFTFVTWDVIDATCGCLLAQAEEAEKAYHSLSVAEHMILEEFGRCLAQILHLAWKSKGLQCL